MDNWKEASTEKNYQNIFMYIVLKLNTRDG